MFCLQLTDEVLPCDAGAGFAVCRSNREQQAQPHLILTFSFFMTTANSLLVAYNIPHPTPPSSLSERLPSPRTSPSEVKGHTLHPLAYCPDTPKEQQSTAPSTPQHHSLACACSLASAMPGHASKASKFRHDEEPRLRRATSTNRPSPSTWSTPF